MAKKEIREAEIFRAFAKSGVEDVIRLIKCPMITFILLNSLIKH
jgi:hypothetical protein